MFVNETMHPQAEELTSALFAKGASVDEDKVYEVVERLQGVGEAAKADLYARLVESSLMGLGKMAAGSVVSKALWQNQKVYPRGW